MNRQTPIESLKVALVYDHLTTAHGGAEIVIEALLQLFPHSPIFTSVYEKSARPLPKGTHVKSSFLQHLGPLKKYHQLLVPFHPLAFESLDLSSYDIIISISSGAAKGILTSPHQLHVCYLLSPTRYLIQDTETRRHYFSSHGVVKLPLISELTDSVLSYLRRWDIVAASRPDKVIAISELIKQKTETHYHRSTDSVIYPPYILGEEASPPSLNSSYFLCLSRLVSYKRFELAITGCKKKQVMLVIAGDGVYRKTLIKTAGHSAYIREKHQSIEDALRSAQKSHKSVLFTLSCTEKEKAKLLAGCTALVMPGEEDFGLVGLEAASYGKPVITYYKSGIAEVLPHKIAAVHIRHSTVAEVVQGLSQVESLPFSSAIIKKVAKQYNVDYFKKQFQNTIYQFWQQHSTISDG